MGLELDAGDGFFLSKLVAGDAPALARWLAERDVSKWTLRIPHPYSLADAMAFLKLARERERKTGKIIDFAIRREDAAAIGGLGFLDWTPGARETEIGYWLAKPYWGRGIMPRAIEAVLAYAFEELAVKRLTAHVFVGNRASAKVLEKRGFRFEGTLKGLHEKDGVKLDSWRYVLAR